MYPILRQISFLFLILNGNLLAQDASSIAYIGGENCMEYITDQENNYIPNFSHAGYKGGGIPLPVVPTLLTIQPIPGDNTEHIQQSLDSIAQLPLNENGIRGALHLAAGIYEIHGQLFIKESGIVLRGAGDGLDSTATILKGIGNVPNLRDLIIAGGATNSWNNGVPNTYINITNTFLPAGSRSLEIADLTPFKVGDQIIIVHPSTDKWLASIDYGATHTDEPWTAGTIDIYYNRYITSINPEENKIILDVPIFDHFDQDLAQAYIYKLNEPNIKRNIGIENLRIDIETNGELTEDHVKSAISLKGVEDCWVTNVTAEHFYYAAVYTQTANRITIKDCKGLNPHSQITGARRYNFAVARRSNNILFENCHASKGRHAFVSNGTSSVAGIVFYNCSSEQDFASSEGHRRWSQGLLYDNLQLTNSQTDRLLGLYNRGSYGTGHGWACTNCVAWNVNTNTIFRQIILQKPPHRQNYAIGCTGLVTNSHQFSNPVGFIELTRKEVTPSSLYEAQLNERLERGIRPDAPARLAGTIATNTQKINLTWLDISAEETGYVVEYAAESDADFQIIGELLPNATSYEVPELNIPLENLRFRVYAINEVCKSPYSNPITVERTVSNQEVSIPDLSVFPNPFQDKLFIKGATTLSRIIIFDVYGKQIRNIARDFSANDSIALNDLTTGLYYFQVSDTQGRLGHYKLIKF